MYGFGELVLSDFALKIYFTPLYDLNDVGVIGDRPPLRGVLRQFPSLKVSWRVKQSGYKLFTHRTLYLR